MRQAFVPATGEAGGDNASKKRRRVGAAGEGQAVASIYESIVQPGKNSSLGNSNSSGNSSNGNKSIWGRSIERDPGYRSGASAPPVPPPPPLPPLPPPEANDCSPRERERSRARMPAPPVVFGPAPNPSNPHHSATNNTGRDGEELEEEEEGFFCRVCGERVKSVSEEQHGTSTLHIFNQKHRPQERKVQIHESNKGFQLLAGMGWKLDEGLGARKQGRVNPLQTTFKRGTTGLGAGGKLRPRVTHFPSHVPSQALNAPDGKSDAVRAHESLDRRQGRRSNNSSSSSKGRRLSHDSGAGSGGVGGGGGFEVSSGGVGGTAFDVGGSAAAAAAGGGSDGSWGGFWGQGTYPGSNSSSSGGGGGGGGGGGASGRSSERSTSIVSSSGRRMGVGGGGKGGGNSNGGTGYFMSRKEREAQSERERRKARRARFELLSDVPEEYAALFMDERIM